MCISYSVIRRLVTLLSTQAKTQMDYEVAMKQAQSASDMAKKLLEEKDNKVMQIARISDFIMMKRKLISNLAYIF